jgi:hypothetical protein
MWGKLYQNSHSGTHFCAKNQFARVLGLFVAEISDSRRTGTIEELERCGGRLPPQ